MTKRSVVHIEIPAADRKIAAQFYGEMFGWESQHMSEEMHYTTFSAGNTGGGYNELGEHTKPGDVIIYVESDNIEADLQKAERLGGKCVMEKTEIPGYGWFAHFKDPTGNTVALWTPAPMPAS